MCMFEFSVTAVCACEFCVHIFSICIRDLRVSAVCACVCFFGACEFCMCLIYLCINSVCVCSVRVTSVYICAMHVFVGCVSLGGMSVRHMSCACTFMVYLHMSCLSVVGMCLQRVCVCRACVSSVCLDAVYLWLQMQPVGEWEPGLWNARKLGCCHSSSPCTNYSSSLFLVSLSIRKLSPPSHRPYENWMAECMRSTQHCVWHIVGALSSIAIAHHCHIHRDVSRQMLSDILIQLSGRNCCVFNFTFIIFYISDVLYSYILSL